MTTTNVTSEEIHRVKEETNAKLRGEVLRAYPAIPQEDYFLLGYFLFFMGRLAFR